MISLISFAPFQPTPGLALWSLIIFLLFWWLMSKYAFKPIAEGLKKRENDIQSALDEAKNAREEMSNLKAENEKILAQAREERSVMLNEAKETQNNILAEARTKAKEEASRIINNAKLEIESEKTKAVAELKDQAGLMALNVAEKILRKEMKGNPEHESFVAKLVNEIKLN